jgi:hypothetical protein
MALDLGSTYLVGAKVAFGRPGWLAPSIRVRSSFSWRCRFNDWRYSKQKRAMPRKR